jgi:hypothetical protein
MIEGGKRANYDEHGRATGPKTSWRTPKLIAATPEAKRNAARSSAIAEGEKLAFAVSRKGLRHLSHDDARKALDALRELVALVGS